MNALAAALGLLLAAPAFAAGAPKAKPAKPKAELSRTAGKITHSSAKLAPSPDGPVFREGRITLLDKADHVEEFKATPATKVTLDGKPSKFSKAASIGTLVLKALYDPDTKELASLDLKSAPAPKPDADDPAGPGAVRGEVANTDVFKNILTVRAADKTMREYMVPERAMITREAEGKRAEPIGLEKLAVGDSVEVFSADGKSADEIHARAAR